MTFTSASPLGRIFRNPAARDLFFGAVPELDGSPNLHFIRGWSLEHFADYTKRDPAWLQQLVGQLANVPDVAPDDRAIEPRADYESDDVPVGSAALTAPTTVPLWAIAELTLSGPDHGNPFTDVDLTARFSDGQHAVEAVGFYDGDGTYGIRFMPDAPGAWTFRTASNARSLDAIEGSFTCGLPTADAHGPVRVAETFHFAYADGTPYRPMGTTCYAWTHQGDELERRTLASLAASPFNKLRMCVFPKAYLFNDNEPERHAFERRDDGTFDFARFDVDFFRHLEQRVADLAALGIEADIILFHPYDRWGYAELPPSVDDRYLRYVVARLAAYSNVWWSLANEYDLMWDKEGDDWERFGSLVGDLDPHHHLIGVHQCEEFFDNSRPWVTHSSLQRVDHYRTAENTTEWRSRWSKPVVIDECAYEGDIDMQWGNISGEEMTRRTWEGVARGGYVGHGETYLSPDDVLWWSKGGELRGSSPARIAFLRAVLEEAPHPLEPVPELMVYGYPTIGCPGEYYLQYLGLFQPRVRTIELPADQSYRVDVIDTWNMTIDDAGVHSGTSRIELPARPYIAIRMIRTTG